MIMLLLCSLFSAAALTLVQASYVMPESTEVSSKGVNHQLGNRRFTTGQ